MTIIYFILILGLVILVHEFGHLIMAKIFNIYCYEFSIGMGPKLISKKGQETEYSIRAIPIGGFVRMAGEEKLDTDPDVLDNRKLNGINPFKRIIIMLAGIFNNIILGIVAMAIVYLLVGNYVKYPKPIIKEVNVGYPAEKVGLQANDEIIKMTFDNGLSFKPRTFSDVSSYLMSFEGDVKLTIKRGNDTFDVNITPIIENDRKLIGVTMYDIEIKKVNGFNSLYYGLLGARDLVLNVYDTLANLIRGIGFDSLSGPVGIYEVTNDVMNQATSFKEIVFYFFELVGLLSVNVGIMNLLPIPALDGGRVLLCLIEIITGKPLNKKIEQAIITGSMIILLLLFAYVMFNDIGRIF